MLDRADVTAEDPSARMDGDDGDDGVTDLWQLQTPTRPMPRRWG